MTELPCTRRLNGLRGATIHTSPSSILRLLAQLIQVVVIHLATDGSRGAATTLSRSLSTLASAHHSSSVRADNQLRVGPSSNSKTRTSGNSLVNAISVDEQGTKHRSVNPSHNQPAEVTSLTESLHNLVTRWDQAHIIRETSERATRED